MKCKKHKVSRNNSTSENTQVRCWAICWKHGGKLQGCDVDMISLSPLEQDIQSPCREAAGWQVTELAEVSSGKEMPADKKLHVIDGFNCIQMDVLTLSAAIKQFG